MQKQPVAPLRPATARKKSGSKPSRNSLSRSARRGDCTSTRIWVSTSPTRVYALELDDHRSLSGGLSVGAFPHDQGGGQDAHTVGLAR